MKRILFISPEQFGYLTDHYYLSLYAKNKYKVTFVCFDKGYKKMDAQGIELIYLDYNCGKISRSINFIKMSLLICVKKKIDIVFCVHTKFSLIFGVLIKAPLKILDIRTGSLQKSKFKRNLINYRIKLYSLFFKKVTIISESLRERLRLPESKCTILPLGAVVFDDSLKEYDKLNLIYVGSLHMRSIEKTIDGLSLFLHNNKVNLDINYDIIGFGHKEDEEKIKKYILKNSLEKIVNFHGRISHSELQPFFKKATIGVCFVPQTPFFDIQPSTKLFEYAMSGLINIATNTFENRKFITPENGVICEDNALAFADALQAVYNNLHQYVEQEIRDSLSEYSWENIFVTKFEPVLS